MIPPSLLNITYYFSLLPVYEPEPAPTTPCPSPAADGNESSADIPAQTAGNSNAGDADGVNDQVALRMVFKGYKLTAVPQWEAQANTGYERWVENRGDDDAERQRQDQRARSAARPPSPLASSGPEAATTPSVSTDGE